MPSVDDILGTEPAPQQSQRTVDDILGPVPQGNGGSSPLHDSYFTDSPTADILNAFGQGAKQGWGSEPLGLSPEAEKFLQKSGVFNDYKDGQSSLIKSFNEAIIRPGAAGLDAASRAGSALFSGAQGAVAEFGKQAGQPELGRAIAAAPEAFFGTPHPLGMPEAPVAPDLPAARELGIIGEGEAGWKGTATPLSPDEVRAAEAEAIRRLTPSQEGAAPETAPTPAETAKGEEPNPAAATSEPGPTIHDVARNLDPDTFRQYDALSQQTQTFRRWLSDLSDTRDQAATAEIDQQISDLQTRLETATGRRAANWNNRLGELQTQREQVLMDANRDTPDMVRVRQALMDADYKMRDLAPNVSAAYRQAQELMPEAAEGAPEAAPPGSEAQAAPEPAQAPQQAIEGQQEEAQPPRAVLGGAQPAGLRAPGGETPAELRGPAINIQDEVARKLMGAGRPEEEANAAAALVAAHYDARAARLKGANPPELYRSDFPEIRAANSNARVREAAQRELNQSAPQRPAFRKWFGKSKVVDPETGEPGVVYHGTTGDFTEFSKDRLGAESGAPSARRGFFFTSDTAVASSYAKGINAYEGEGTPAIVRFAQWATGGRYANFNEALLKLFGLGPGIKHGENVKPVYLSIQNPLVYDFAGNEYRERSFDDLIRQAKDDGHDGVIFRNAVDPGYNTNPGSENPSDIYVAFEPEQIKSAVGNRGTFSPDSPNILHQAARGKIALRESRNIITLFKNADASTFIHETGHQWLEELMQDADDERATAQTKADAQTVRDWLGAKDGEPIARGQHEKFARGFERYMMEGVAPSQKLASVFAQFKQWLTKIYETVSRLRSPITDDIRQVFDRMLSTPGEKPIIAPEREAERSIGEDHAELAAKTPPEQADTGADKIRAEADEFAKLRVPEIADELGIGRSETAGRAPEGGEPDGHGNAGQSEPGGPGGGAPTGTVGAGGSVAAPESGGVSTIERPGTEQPRSPTELFGEPETHLIDKAGNIRLDNLGTPEDVNAVIREAADRNRGFITARRGVISDAQVLDLADALGMDAAELNKRKLGQAFNAEQIVAARKLLIQSATSVRDAMAKAANGSDADVMAYAEAKARHQMIQERVSGITAEAGRALRAFRALEGSEQAQMVGDFLKDATGQTLFQLRREAKLGAQLDTPQQVSKFVKDSTKPTFGDMLLEYWINGLISGPATHTTYSIGNSLLALWKAGPETGAAAAIGAVRHALGGEGERVLAGEVPAQLFGMLRGTRQGVLAAWKSLKTGKTTLLPGEEEAMSAREFANSPMVNPREAIPNFTVGGVPLPVGTLARLPSRGVAVIHSFFRAVNYQREMAALSYRAAVEAEKGDEATAALLGKTMTNPDADLMQKARASATDLTLMGRGGELTQAISQLTNARFAGGQWLKFVDPFVHISSNVIEQSLLQRTPIGVLSKAIRADLAGVNGPIARDTAIAKMAMGTALGVAVGSLAAEGLVNGSGPSDPKQAALYTMVNGPPHSVKIGDTWYATQRLGVLGMLTGIAADLYEVGHQIGSEDSATVAHAIVHAFSQNILDESFMRGPAELIQALGDPDRYGPRYVSNFLSSFTPYSVGSGQVARAVDPYARQARGILDSVKAKIPWLSEALLPRRDIWGEPIQNRSALGGAGLTAIYEAKVNNDPVNQALLNAGIYPSLPERKIRGVQLTGQEYDDYSRIAGRMAKARLDAMVKQPGFSSIPEGVRREMMTSAISGSRETARSLVMMQNPDIIKKATDAKLARLNGPSH